MFQKIIYTNVYSIFIQISPNQKRSKCPPTNEWIKIMRYIPIMKYYSAKKRMKCWPSSMMDASENHHAEWKKPGWKKFIPSDIPFIGILENAKRRVVVAWEWQGLAVMRLWLAVMRKLLEIMGIFWILTIVVVPWVCICPNSSACKLPMDVVYCTLIELKNKHLFFKWKYSFFYDKHCQKWATSFLAFEPLKSLFAEQFSLLSWSAAHLDKTWQFLASDCILFWNENLALKIKNFSNMLMDRDIQGYRFRGNL